MIHPSRITVICSFEELRHSLCALLDAYDFEVFEYSSIDHCVENASSKSLHAANVDIAVIDLDQAREDELNALRHLRRKLPQLRNVMAITPYCDKQFGLKAKAAGADVLVERPYVPTLLITAVKQLAVMAPIPRPAFDGNSEQVRF